MSGPHVLPFGSFIHCIVDRLSTNKGHDIVFFLLKSVNGWAVIMSVQMSLFISKMVLWYPKKIPFSIPVYFTIEKYNLLRKYVFFFK